MTDRLRADAGATGDALSRALAESEARCGALIDRTGYGHFTATVDGRVIGANEALARMLGYDRCSELVDRRLVPDVYDSASDFEVGVALAADTAFSRFIEARWWREDGAPITVRVALRSARERDGTSLIEGIVDDLTERLRHEELLRRSERMASLGTALAGVAHELNNPLAAITGFAQILLSRIPAGDDRVAVETINQEAQRAAAIVLDLLAVARRRESEPRTQVQLPDVVGYVARTRRDALDAFGIALTLEIDPRTPTVRGDRAQLEHAVLNLVNNAEQALRGVMDSPDGWQRPTAPRIAIRVRPASGNEVVLDVDDNGPGIPEGATGQIWDPFWTTKAEGEGTGLGLAVVHAIAADHGGSVAVTSAPGGGARFTVRLPVDNPREAGKAREAGS